MKVLVLLPFLFISTILFSQDTSMVQKRWAVLTSQFLVKSEAAKYLAITALDSKKVDKKDAEKVRGFSFAVGQVLRMSSGPDKAVIARVSQVSDSLNFYLNKTLQGLKKDKDFLLLKSYSENKNN